MEIEERLMPGEGEGIGPTIDPKDIGPLGLGQTVEPTPTDEKLVAEGEGPEIPQGVDTAGAGEVSPPEKTEEQQKIDTLVNQVREVNDQLGGKVAAEVRFDSGRSTSFFARRFRLMQRLPEAPTYVYGVDSVHGPVFISGKLSEGLSQGNRDAIDLKLVSTVTENEVRKWVHPVRNEIELIEWQKAFELSKETVLQDQMEMRRLREARDRTLDQALSVVSKPIDINAGSAETQIPPPPAAGRPPIS